MNINPMSIIEAKKETTKKFQQRIKEMIFYMNDNLQIDEQSIQQLKFVYALKDVDTEKLISNTSKNNT